ncbi:hypothetical protein ABT404_26250 [Streptomyces hyaluromycini]|uniref:Lipoprotein n=1 Tax=Streptomyces hyaluromycini TaxID=1377993 RepID=A0ABV1X1Q0_9ACTN
MRRTVLSIAAILLLTAACKSGTTTHNAAAHSPTPKATQSSHTAAAPSHSASPAAKSKAKPKPSHTTKGCSHTSPTRDVLVWYKTPGLPNSAQVLGNYDLVLCETTFQSLTHTSPTGAGYCTEAAYASDNPGYDAEATPAKRLKKVQVAVGPAC